MYKDDPMSFFKGVIFGVAVGAVAGILLAPKSGKETRDDIKKFVEVSSEKVTDIYADAKREIRKKLAHVKKAGELIDETKYKSLVREVINEFKRDSKVSVKVAEELGEQLKSDWVLVKKELMK